MSNRWEYLESEYYLHFDPYDVDCEDDEIEDQEEQSQENGTNQ